LNHFGIQWGVIQNGRNRGPSEVSKETSRQHLQGLTLITRGYCRYIIPFQEPFRGVLIWLFTCSANGDNCKIDFLEFN
jgi:hypothetical protein